MCTMEGVVIELNARVLARGREAWNWWVQTVRGMREEQAFVSG